MDERACGKGKRLGVIMCVGVCVGLQRSLQRSAFIITMLNLVTWAVPVKRHRGAGTHTRDTRYRYVGRTGRLARLRGTLIHTF